MLDILLLFRNHEYADVIFLVCLLLTQLVWHWKAYMHTEHTSVKND